MTQEFELYNFDHGFKKTHKILINDYEIEIEEKHCLNLSKIEKNAYRSFETNNDLTRSISYNEKISGEIVPTAKVRINSEKIVKSHIYVEIEDKTIVDDFVLFLSFISGRRVYLYHEINDNVSLKYKDTVVNRNFYHLPSCNIDLGFKNIEAKKLMVQFYNLIHLKTFNDLPTICFYVNTIINKLYDTWCRENDFSKYPSIAVNVDEIKSVIESHLASKNISEETVSDICARVNVNNQPSALYKLGKFLSGLGLYPEEPTDDNHKRLRWVNTVRNSMVQPDV